MNKFKLIIKGILLWTTAFVTILFVAGVDSIYDKGMDTFLGMIVLIGILIFCCIAAISEKNLDIITFNKYLKKYLGEDN